LAADEANMLFGPKDTGVKALAWSPKGMAPLGGYVIANKALTQANLSLRDRCFLAVLETNLNLTIRSTEKDYIQGAWLDVRETRVEPVLR
jgi:hypothetical protein